MKFLCLSVVLMVVAVASANIALQDKKSHIQKKATLEAEKKHLASIEQKLEALHQLEDELVREIEEAEEEEAVQESSDEENEMLDEQVDDEEEPVNDEPYDVSRGSIEDRCVAVYCGAGRTCAVNDDGEAECVCVNACEMEVDPRRRVCSNFNETWMSDCELYRQRCLCQEEDESCVNVENKHAHIEYYGECQEVPECSEDELEDFPRRMSEWLFNIMRDMAERHLLSEHYVRLERAAEEDPKKQWSYAVVWKWCDLDTHPKDKAVSRHELFPIKAQLFTLENCIATFLDSCDADDDHSITLKEWALCTKLSEEDMDKFENFCEDLREDIE